MNVQFYHEMAYMWHSAHFSGPIHRIKQKKDSPRRKDFQKTRARGRRAQQKELAFRCVDFKDVMVSKNARVPSFLNTCSR